jgi:hypothetical protein
MVSALTNETILGKNPFIYSNGKDKENRQKKRI